MLSPGHGNPVSSCSGQPCSGQLFGICLLTTLSCGKGRCSFLLCESALCFLEELNWPHFFLFILSHFILQSFLSRNQSVKYGGTELPDTNGSQRKCLRKHFPCCCRGFPKHLAFSSFPLSALPMSRQETEQSGFEGLLLSSGSETMMCL